MQHIKEWHEVDQSAFLNEIIPANQPAVLRSLVKHWPATIHADRSIQSFCDYIKPLDRHVSAEVFLGAPEIKGRFWYGPEMRGFNFERKAETLSITLDRLLTHLNDSDPPAIYAGSVPVRQSMPQFALDNPMAILDAAIEPRIWIGNRVRVQTHFDISENLACVVAGKRRFTLFPPEQLSNLYIGPLDFTMAGQPVSMVQLDKPDLEKYPKFVAALDAAYSAELAPGDAIYIPYMWWHHVESLTPFNVLVNYWWDNATIAAGSPFEALVHAIMAVKSLNPTYRDVWRKYFDHFVFESNGDPAIHLHHREKGILHSLSPQLVRHIKNWLMNVLSRS